jgi:nicotinate-nucleotide adenylyltransferase
MQKVGIFGGTFDPVHWGHLAIAQTALSQFELDRVIWVPAHYPPHKLETAMAAPQQRLEMVQRAIANQPAFVLESVPQHHSGSSYAIETLQQLQALYPHSEWYWILGTDSFQTLPRWHRRQELIPTINWLVAPRIAQLINAAPSSTHQQSYPDGIEPQIEQVCQQVVVQLETQFIPIRWSLLQMPPVDLSSSLIRYCCLQGHSIRDLVPEPVRLYIETHRLYQN